MTIHKTTTADHGFIAIEKLLDAELRSTYPDTIDIYTPHNKFETPIKSILIQIQDKVVACGAFKELGDHVEIKRMFVHPDFRRQGLSRKILLELENWAKSLGYQYAKLETGKRLPNAIRLYKTSGYTPMAKYEPYTHLEESVCLKKIF